jgi:hypothetical protein
LGISTGDALLKLIDLPGGGAWSDHQGETATRGRLPISAKYLLMGDTEAALNTSLCALEALQGVQDDLYIEVAHNSVCSAEAVLTSVKGTRRAKDLTSLEITMNFTVLSPTWRGARHSGSGWVFDSGEYFDSGLHFDEADSVYLLSDAKSTLTVTNGGNATVKNCVLTIRAGLGSITGVLIQRKVGSTVYEHLTWAGTLASGKDLVINCGAHTVTNDGANAYSGFALGASHRTDDWLRLLSGANTIEITLTGGGATDISSAGFTFYDGWV